MKSQHLSATLPRRSQPHRSLLALPSTESVPRKSALKKPVIMVTEEEHHASSSSRTSLLSMETGGQIRPMRRQDAPYIRPTKFVPVLDYFSSSSDREDITSVYIKPKWKPGEEKQQLSQWRKVTYEVHPGGEARQKRRDSLSSLVDKNMQEMNKQFKANISHLSQGLCYNHMERKIQSDLGDYSAKGEDEKKGPCPRAEAPGTIVTTTSGDGSVEDANPLIYFKYDFGYEFGIACPRAQSEPPTSKQSNLQLPGGSSRPSSWIESSDDTPISLPIIHETSKKE